MNARIIGALCLMLVSWASAFPAIRVGIKSYSPEHLALGRFLVASAVLIGIALFQHWPLPRKRDLPAIALMGFLGFSLYNVALNKGEETAPAGIASFLIGTAPVFVAILATLVLGEHLHPLGWAGIALSLAGVGILALNDDNFQLSPGALLVLLASLSASIYTILQKRLLQSYGSFVLLAYSIWWGTFFLLVYMPGFRQTLRLAPLETTLLVVYLGLIPTVLGYAMMAYVLARVPASLAISFLYLVPVLATGMAYLWLGEALTWRALCGGVLALLGVALVSASSRVKRPAVVIE